jgi:hypothetical protein
MTDDLDSENRNSSKPAIDTTITEQIAKRNIPKHIVQLNQRKISKLYHMDLIIKYNIVMHDQLDI